VVTVVDLKITLCDRDSGECAGIEKINNVSVKGLKRWITINTRINENAEIVVFDSETVEVAEYFERYIKKINRFKRFVGIKDPVLREFVYEELDIRPLHIVQELSANFTNLKYALIEDDKDLYDKMVKERKEIYQEARYDFGLTMSVLNQYLWNEDYKYNLEVEMF
jgi:hypothetical protein